MQKPLEQGVCVLHLVGQDELRPLPAALQAAGGLRERARDHHRIEAPRERVGEDAAVEILAARAQLQHGAQHGHPCPSRVPLQDVERGAHAQRVGVVAVEQEREPTHAPHLPTHPAGLHRGDPLRGRRRPHAQHLRDGEREQRVVHQVPPRHPQRHAGAAPLEGVRPGGVRHHVHRPQVGVGALGPAGHAHPRPEAASLGWKRLGRVSHHGAAVRAQALQQRELFLEHAFHRAQLLEVALPHRRDDSDVGPGDGGQCRDLAGLVGAHLRHHHVGVGGSGEERERKADPVVQVAQRGVHAER